MVNSWAGQFPVGRRGQACLQPQGQQPGEGVPGVALLPTRPSGSPEHCLGETGRAFQAARDQGEGTWSVSMAGQSGQLVAPRPGLR